MFTLYIDGQQVEDQEPVSQPQYDAESLRIQLEDVERSSGYDESCRHCGELISDQGHGWHHNDTDAELCDVDDEDSERAEPSALAWCNSAAITLDPDDDAVHLSISVGDPRGAFTFTVRKIGTLYDGSGTITNPELAGRLVIHTPYPGEGLPHMTTEQLHPGTLIVR